METGIDKDTFKQISRDHGNMFTAENPSHDGTGYHDEVVQKMLGCGDPEKMGFAQYRCTSCGETRRTTGNLQPPSAHPAHRRGHYIPLT